MSTSTETERYSVESLTICSADYVSCLTVHVLSETKKHVNLTIQNEARIYVNNQAATWHYLIGWLMETKNAVVSIIRDEDRYGLIVEARFTKGVSREA